MMRIMTTLYAQRDMDGITPKYFTELFRLIRSRPSQSPDKRRIMGNSF